MIEHQICRPLFPDTEPFSATDRLPTRCYGGPALLRRLLLLTRTTNVIGANGPKHGTRQKRMGKSDEREPGHGTPNTRHRRCRVHRHRAGGATTPVVMTSSASTTLNNYYSVELKERRMQRLQAAGSDRFEFVKLDISEIEALNAVLTTRPFDLIVHLGAQAGARYSIDNPHAYVRSNLVGTSTCWNSAGIAGRTVSSMHPALRYMAGTRASRSRCRTGSTIRCRFMRRQRSPTS